MSSRAAVAVLVLLAVALGAETVRAEGTPLRLVWCDPSDLALETESVARSEASALLGRLGAAVSWRHGQAREVRKPDEVWVVLVGKGPASGARAHVLGATPRLPQVAPLVWVRVPHVRAAAGIEETRSSLGLSVADRRRLGVALGRVVAHEVVHAVVPSVPHGSGLMSDILDRRQLTAGTIPIDAEATLAFRAALRGDPVRMPPANGALVALETAAGRDR